MAERFSRRALSVLDKDFFETFGGSKRDTKGKLPMLRVEPAPAPQPTRRRALGKKGGSLFEKRTGEKLKIRLPGMSRKQQPIMKEIRETFGRKMSEEAGSA